MSSRHLLSSSAFHNDNLRNCLNIVHSLPAYDQHRFVLFGVLHRLLRVLHLGEVHAFGNVHGNVHGICDIEADQVHHVDASFPQCVDYLCLQVVILWAVHLISSCCSSPVQLRPITLTMILPLFSSRRDKRIAAGHTCAPVVLLQAVLALQKMSSYRHPSSWCPVCSLSSCPPVLVVCVFLILPVSRLVRPVRQFSN